MLSRIRPRFNHATVVAYLALFVALGSGSYAAVKINGQNIKKKSIAGEKLKNRTITRTKVKTNTLTRTEIDESKLDKVSQANRADVATQADTATTATNATNLDGLPPSAYQGKARWALVRASGTVAASSGGITVQHTPASGVYIIDFGSSVASRPILATLHEVTGIVNAAPCGGSGSPGGIDCATSNDINHLFVSTHDPTGAFADRDFYVVVEAP